MKGFGEKNQSKKEITSKNKQKVNISQLIKKAFELQSQGKKLEAANPQQTEEGILYYQKKHYQIKLLIKSKI